MSTPTFARLAVKQSCNFKKRLSIFSLPSHILRQINQVPESLDILQASTTSLFTGLPEAVLTSLCMLGAVRLQRSPHSLQMV
jgi:hypothetical protein